MDGVAASSFLPLKWLSRFFPSPAVPPPPPPPPSNHTERERDVPLHVAVNYEEQPIVLIASSEGRKEGREGEESCARALPGNPPINNSVSLLRAASPAVKLKIQFSVF